MPLFGALQGLLVIVSTLIITAGSGSASAPQFKADQHGYVGSKACSVCHGEIARAYAATGMARASGPAKNAQVPEGKVWDAKAGVTYFFRWQSGIPRLTYDKVLNDGTTVSGVKTLLAYIGSGAHARGFAFEEQHQPFQSPIAYYGPVRGWELAPGYDQEKKILLSRKLEGGCLNCHASGMGGTREQLFAEGTVSCERCHGPGEKHIDAMHSGKPTPALGIVNPRKLQPEERDSVCAQCHLTGEVRVVKPHRSELTYVPGDRLSSHVVPFVWTQSRQSEIKVIGHFEGLWQSKCKRVSGDKLWCGTCHDPHREIAIAEKPNYYRDKCLTCHQSASCKAPAAIRARQQDSCIACHMQQMPSTDGQHTAFTDHTIAKVPRHLPAKAQQSEELKAFWPKEVTLRDQALAYADLAWRRGDANSIRTAHQRLQSVLPLVGNDGEVEAQLAYTDDLGGDTEQAGSLYRRALEDDPDNLIALSNYATHLARQDQVDAAERLWRKALSINPGLQVPGLNLARAEAAQGHAPAALEILKQVLSINPDSEAARTFLHQLTDEAGTAR